MSAKQRRFEQPEWVGGQAAHDATDSKLSTPDDLLGDESGDDHTAEPTNAELAKPRRTVGQRPGTSRPATAHGAADRAPAGTKPTGRKPGSVAASGNARSAAPKRPRVGVVVGIIVASVVIVAITVGGVVAQFAPDPDTYAARPDPKQPVPVAVDPLPPSLSVLPSGTTVSAGTPFAVKVFDSNAQATVLETQRFAYGEDGQAAGKGWAYLAVNVRYVVVSGEKLHLLSDRYPVVVDPTDREYAYGDVFYLPVGGSWFVPSLYLIVDGIDPGTSVTGWLVFRVPDDATLRLRVSTSKDSVVYVPLPDETALISTQPGS